jgi:hypothetical protein
LLSRGGSWKALSARVSGHRHVARWPRGCCPAGVPRRLPSSGRAPHPWHRRHNCRRVHETARPSVLLRGPAVPANAGNGAVLGRSISLPASTGFDLLDRLERISAQRQIITELRSRLPSPLALRSCGGVRCSLGTGREGPAPERHRSTRSTRMR